jgi:hypothetical protein
MPHFTNVDNFLTFKSPDGSQEIALSLKRRNFVKKADEITMILNELQERTEVLCTAKQFEDRHQLIHWYTRVVNNHLIEFNLENEYPALTDGEQEQIDNMCDAFAKDMMSNKVVNHCIHKYVEEKYVNQLDNITANSVKKVHDVINEGAKPIYNKRSDIIKHVCETEGKSLAEKQNNLTRKIIHKQRNIQQETISKINIKAKIQIQKAKIKVLALTGMK